MKGSMFQVVGQKPNVDGTITVIADNFANGALAGLFNGGSVSGVITVGPHADFPGAEAQVHVVLTITPAV